MPILALALSLLAAEPAAVAEAAPISSPGASPAAEAPWPVGAPRDDYQFVAWCYGALRGYLDLHDEVMPEVTRIESTFRRPGAKLEDDLKVYDQEQKQGREDLKKFQAALTAAEKASIRPINAAGAEAIARGRGVWSAGPNVSKARKAQEWMSWTLPARCQTTAATLEARARLASPALKANIEATTSAPAEVAPKP